MPDINLTAYTYDIFDIKRVQADIFILLENIDLELAKNVNSVINSFKLSKLLNKDPTKNDLLLLEEIKTEYPSFLCEDPVELISVMMNIMREDSKGAVYLNKVFVGQDVYTRMVEKTSLSNVPEYITIRGVKVKKSLFLKPKEIIGLGLAKFRNVPAEQLVIRGQIK